MCLHHVRCKITNQPQAPLGSSGIGGDETRPRLPSPVLPPKGIQMLGQAGRGPEKEERQMLTNGAREAFCPKISVSQGKRCLPPHCHELQNNSTEGDFARFLIKT